MIKAVIFDLGEVLITLNTAQCIESFKSKAGFEAIDQFLDAKHQKGPIGLLEGGDISEEEFYNQCFQYCRPGTVAQDIRDSFGDIFDGIVPDKIKLIKELGQKYDLYILTNNNPITLPVCRKIFASYGLPMDAHFKKVFASYEMKMLKPCREIYLKVLEETGLQAEEILFIDDSQSNVDMANSLGINARYYIPKSDLRALVTDALKELEA